MKKFILVAILAVSALCMFAQTPEEKAVIEEAKSKLTMNSDQGFSYVRIYEDLGKSKDELISIIKNFLPDIVSNDWRNNNLNMQVDEEAGTVVAKVSHDIVSNWHNMAHSFTTKAAPTMRFDCKDNRVRVIISEKEWDVTHLNKSGILQKVDRNNHNTAECPPFKSSGKKYADKMYYETFCNVYRIDMELFEKFDKFVRGGGVTIEKADDNW